MAIDLDAQVRLADLRLRSLNGERLTATEMRELLLDLQRGRDMAAATARSTAAKARRVAKPKPEINLADLFGQAHSNQ